MSNSRFNTLFGAMVMGALLCALLIPPGLTDRARQRADVVLTPVSKPARAIASMFSRRWGAKPLPPGETTRPTDQALALENSDLKQQVAFLSLQLQQLTLVEAERKRLGPLIQYFKPVGVIGGDATPGRESLSILPTSGGEFAPGSPVICPEGLVGRLTDARRVRLVTDPGYKITGAFVRWADGGVWKPIDAPKGACTGIGNNTIRIDNLTMKEAEALKPTDWVTVADLTDYPELLQGRPFAQIKTIRPLAAKPLFAEIIAEPRVDLRKLREVMVMKK
jgi:cell shape-determining protein MreC